MAMKFYLPLFSLLIVFYSCTKSPAPSTNTPNTSDSSISAQINGVEWGTNNITLIKDTFTNTLTAFIGNGSGTTMQIGIFTNPAFSTGTYNFRPAGIDSTVPGSVVFSSFTALDYSSTTRLSWNTQQEVNMNSYEIERSFNGVDFSAIGNVQATGNNNTGTNNYSFIDQSPIPGENYYRIKAIAENGNVEYTSVTVVHFSIQPATAFYNSIPGSNGNIIIVSNDTTNHITTGTFEFDCVDSTNQLIQIRNGKFNIHY